MVGRGVGAAHASASISRPGIDEGWRWPLSPTQHDKSARYTGRTSPACRYRHLDKRVTFRTKCHDLVRPKKMKEAIRFGSGILGDDGVYVSGTGEIPYAHIAKLYHGSVARYFNGVPLTHTLTIRLVLREGQRITLREKLDIASLSEDKPEGRLEDAKSRFAASLSVLTQLTGLPSKDLSSGVDSFLAGAWSKHRERTVDFCWLVVFGSTSALLYPLVGSTNILMWPALVFLYMSLRKFMQFMSDR